jgi:hypothetical protein
MTKFLDSAKPTASFFMSLSEPEKWRCSRKGLTIRFYNVMNAGMKQCSIENKFLLAMKARIITAEIPI